MIVHAEDSTAIDRAPSAHGQRYRDFLASRPRTAENLAVAHVIEAARSTRARAHILHLSSSDALPMLASARRDGVRVTAETCPHYLALSAEEVPDGATQFKCCPPVREASNRELLWQGVAAGTIDCVVSDHSPCPPELKRLDSGDFGMAWGGISSIEVHTTGRLTSMEEIPPQAMPKSPLSRRLRSGGTASGPRRRSRRCRRSRPARAAPGWTPRGSAGST